MENLNLSGRRRCLSLLLGLALMTGRSAAVALAAEPADPGPPVATETEAERSPWLLDYFKNWFVRIDHSRTQQPGWASPLATTTPTMQNAFRYDITQQFLRDGQVRTIYGSGKGLEFMPAEPLQFIIGVPPYQTITGGHGNHYGWGDESFLMKYRLASANEKEGDYIVTVFMGMTVPNGSDEMSFHHFTFSPTLAFGKGWGDFDIQANLGTTIPDNGAVSDGLGTPLISNTVFQYRLLKYIWPEVEFNFTYWPNGVHEGMNQLFVTPGVVFGKFHLFGRVSGVCGAGCQIAVTDKPIYHRAWILSIRFPF